MVRHPNPRGTSQVLERGLRAKAQHQNQCGTSQVLEKVPAWMGQHRNPDGTKVDEHLLMGPARRPCGTTPVLTKVATSLRTTLNALIDQKLSCQSQKHYPLV